ncbi:hypothetical protein ACFE04_001236 [Oxalis oulophora]
MATKFLASSISALLIISIFHNHLSSARTIPRRHHNQHPHRDHHKITFLMLDVLTNATHFPSSTTEIGSQQPLPFSKPVGIIPPDKGIPLTKYNSPTHRTPDVSNMFFPARVALQELESGSITTFDENIYKEKVSGRIGRAQGICIASSENGTNHIHMVAITVRFGLKDGLRLFGVHQRSSVHESHVAVIGGTGKFLNANGYATIKNTKKLLLFNVYLS